MRMSRCQWFLTLSLSLASFVAGCADPSSGPLGQDKAARSVSPAGGTDDSSALILSARGIERRFAELSEDVPAFSGFHFDKAGNLVVSLTDLRMSQAAGLRLGDILDRRVSHHRAVKQREITFRKVDYTFADLANWRRLSRAAFSLPGIVSIDLDEVRNRVVIGHSSEADLVSIETLLSSRGVPSDAVVLEYQGSPQLISTIHDEIRPIKGAFEVGNSGCTLGFVGLWGGDRAFVTASHCSDVTYALDGGLYYQPSSGISPTAIGFEVADPPPFECPEGWGWPYNNNECRWSDANIVRVYSSIYAVPGLIARTTYWGAVQGSHEIDPSNPEFYVVSEGQYSVVGETVDKIGRTTGWTYGHVTDTCVDFQEFTDGYGRACQDMADYGIDFGDSGSPVFRWFGSDNVQLYGINVGREGESGNAIFSPLSNIQYEFGDISTEYFDGS